MTFARIRLGKPMALLWLALGMAAGCVSSRPETTASPSQAATSPGAASSTLPTSAVEQSWSLVGLEGTAVNVSTERARPTLIFHAKEKRVSGMAAVNRFSGTYTLEGEKLKFGPLMSTKMGGPPELNELETRFLRALERTNAFRIERGELELLAGSQSLARFRVRG